MTFLILCIKLPAPNEHRGSHLCTVGAHTLSMYADAGAVTKREATSFSYPTCNYGSILLTREPGQRCSRAQGLGIGGLAELGDGALSFHLLSYCWPLKGSSSLTRPRLEVSSWWWGSRRPWRKVCSGKWCHSCSPPGRKFSA